MLSSQPIEDERADAGVKDDPELLQVVAVEGLALKHHFGGDKHLEPLGEVKDCVSWTVCPLMVWTSARSLSAKTHPKKSLD